MQVSEALQHPPSTMPPQHFDIANPQCATTMTTTNLQPPKEEQWGEGRKHVCAVAMSTMAHWFFVSLIPVYNKQFFQKEFYPYPMATAGIQLGIVGILLVGINSIQHYLRGKSLGSGSACLAGVPYVGGNAESSFGGVNMALGGAPSPSWVFGPHFWWKMKAVFPIGFLFGLKYGVTNLGLHLVPAPIHLLLQSTDLIWTMITAWWINGEKLSRVGMLCVSGCVVGSVVLSMQVYETVEAPILAIVVNLLSPMLMGLCISTLRSACVELMRKDNCVGGTVSSVEIAALKLFVSSAVAIALACIFENSKEVLGYHVNGYTSNWLSAFESLPRQIKLGVLGSCLPILAFQVNVTFLAGITSAVSVGIVGQLKIIPQWITALLFAPNSDFHPKLWNIIGALITLASAGAYAIHNWFEYSRNQKNVDRVISGDETPSYASADSIRSEDELVDLMADESAGLLGRKEAGGTVTRSISYNTIEVV